MSADDRNYEPHQRYYGRDRCWECGWSADRGTLCFWCLELWCVREGSTTSGQPAESALERILA